MKFNFRKIASVIGTAVMVSSTIGLAAAVSYPAPFVTNGQSNVAIVWGGTNAAQTDSVAATNIGSDLLSHVTTQTVSNTGSNPVTVTGGDSVTLARPSSKLHFGSSVGSVFNRKVTNDDMPNLLADGNYVDGNNDNHDYTQKISVNPALTLGLIRDHDYQDNTPTVGFNIDNNENILNYTLEFQDNPKLSSLKNSNINIMGKQYYILNQENSSDSYLTLLDSANEVTLNSGDTKTVTVGNQTYTVSTSFIGGTSTPQAKLVVNGQTTNTLEAGQTYQLSDGSYIGVKDILVQNYAGGVQQVTFSIGKGKLVLSKDGGEVQVNDNSVDGLTSTISNSSGKLDSLTISWNANDKTFLTENQSITMPVFGNVKLSFAGMTYPDMETTSITSDGDHAVQIQAPLKKGDATIDLLYINDTGSFVGLGEGSDDTQLLTSATNELDWNSSSNDAYFIASYNSSNYGESYQLEFTNFGEQNNKPTVTLKTVNGDWSQNIVGNDTTVNIGDVVLKINNINEDARTVNVTGVGNGVSFKKLYTEDGLALTLPVLSDIQNSTGSYNTSSYDLQFAGEDKDGNLGQNPFTVTVGSSGDTNNEKVGVTGVSGFIGSPQRIQDSDQYVTYMNDSLATKVVVDKSDSDQHTATLTYHGSESYGTLVLSSSSASVGNGNGNGNTGTEVGSLVITDDEVSSVANKNLIVVGGSCVNTVAASLLGVDPHTCGAAWQQATNVGPGEFLIQTFDRGNGNVATLVAGYNAGDTTNAATALTTQNVDISAGNKYTGTSSTSISLETSQTSA